MMKPLDTREAVWDMFDEILSESGFSERSKRSRMLSEQFNLFTIGGDFGSFQVVEFADRHLALIPERMLERIPGADR